MLSYFVFKNAYYFFTFTSKIFPLPDGLTGEEWVGAAAAAHLQSGAGGEDGEPELLVTPRDVDWDHRHLGDTGGGAGHAAHLRHKI